MKLSEEQVVLSSSVDRTAEFSLKLSRNFIITQNEVCFWRSDYAFFVKLEKLGLKTIDMKLFT